MCLAVPMKIVEIRDDLMGVGDCEGVCHEIDLSLIQSPAIGEYVIVHAGYAIEKLDENEARERIALFQELARYGQPQNP